MHNRNWKCGKCGHRVFETGSFMATGGILSKFFNIQNKKFKTVSCSQCGFTEIYKRETSTLGNIFDFFGN